MENPEAAAAYVSSPNASPEPSQQQLSNSAPESVEITTHLKFLVSNAEAGSVIGKGGTTITEFQSQSGARIQLSRNHEVFPGTSDRIIMVSGTFDQVLKAMDLIFSKLLSEIYDEDGDNADPKSRASLIVPNGSCGGIIGKGGATIKLFIEESGAGIKISPQDAYHNRLNDRLVIISGSLDEQLHAIRLVLSKLVEDPHYSQHANAPFAYAAYGANFGTNGARGKFQNNKIPYNIQQEDRSHSTTIGISDDHIGLVVGRGGRNIMEISQISGARIKISDRGDFMSGTNDRKVTITGSQRAIRAAEDMIMQKVNSISEVAN